METFSHRRIIALIHQERRIMPPLGRRSGSLAPATALVLARLEAEIAAAAASAVETTQPS
jgi:hypothetical protein